MIIKRITFLEIKILINCISYKDDNDFISITMIHDYVIGNNKIGHNNSSNWN